VSWRLVIDTATRRTVVAVGQGRTLAAADVLDAPNRHGARLMSQLTSVLMDAGIGMADIAVIGVGTGPGSFTGLRVGLATAKTLAALRHLTLVGLPTDETLRRAAAASLPSGVASDALVLLPAGARDHYLGAAGSDPVLVPPDVDLGAMVGTRPLIAVDVRADAAWLSGCRAAALANGFPDPVDLGLAAAGNLPLALLDVLDARLERGEVADPATLVPRYVALPRGIAAATASAADALETAHGGEGAWSPGYR
jgi:tRNA threonylcarbamoyladenosine biosynthesis protein TsaB